MNLALQKLASCISFVLLAVFFVCRWLKAPNVNVVEPLSNAIAFFDVVKYPPSIAYVCITLGLDMFALALFIFIDSCFMPATKDKEQEDASGSMLEMSFNNSRSTEADASSSSSVAKRSFGMMIWRPFLVFGKAPLFFYLGHIWVLSVLGLPFGAAGCSFGFTYVFWILALCIMFPFTKWYSAFKGKTAPDSYWRLF